MIPIMTRHTIDCTPNGDIVKHCDIIISGEALREGLFKDIDLELLSHIMSFMNEQGECCPSMAILGKQMGLAPSNIKRRVDKLLEAEIEGKPIIKREFIQKSSVKKYSTYSLNVGEEEAPAEEKITSRTVLLHFCKLYEKKYEVPFNVQWARDGSMVKTKLLNVYDPKLVLKSIDYLFENYDKRWMTTKYPRPNIFSMCSWILNEILADMKKQEIASKKAEELMEIDYDALNARAMQLLGE